MSEEKHVPPKKTVEEIMHNLSGWIDRGEGWIQVEGEGEKRISLFAANGDLAFQSEGPDLATAYEKLMETMKTRRKAANVEAGSVLFTAPQTAPRTGP